MSARHRHDDELPAAYDVDILISRLPDNCYVCPFYRRVGYDEDFGCYIEDCILVPGRSCWNIANERPGHCPLKERAYDGEGSSKRGA